MPALQNDLTQGSVSRKLIRYAMPLVASSLLQAIYSITDIIIAGHFIGDNGISAINTSSVIMNMLTQLAIGLTVGGNILVGRYFGSGADEDRKKAAGNTLTVGAIDKKAVLAPFSSIGNTADGRVKPDVVAVGLGADVIRTDGNQGKANGTSFSSPIMCGMVTCLWQACPTLTAKEVIALVRRSGDRAGFPDNIYGYGVPDMWKAYQEYLSAQPR